MYFCQCHPNTLYYHVELKLKGSGCKQLKEKLQTLHMLIQKLLNLLRICSRMNGRVIMIAMNYPSDISQ